MNKKYSNFKYNIEKMIIIQENHRENLILQGYEGKTLDECILKAFQKQDIKFIKYFLEVCCINDELDLNKYFEDIPIIEATKEAVITYQKAVNPVGFLKALQKVGQQKKQAIMK